MKKNIYSKKILYLCTIILYIGLAFIANWSLLIGKNIMKWDILAAHYPYMAFMGDAIKHGQLPLWNPMVQYGTPQYAIAGMPVWYPISLILGLIGYSPYMLGFEYSLHMVLAGFGMFLLIKEYNSDVNKYLGAILSGILYMFSTVFISNAQHIMIIISATWIPYIMLNIKIYLAIRKKKNLFLAGGIAALSLLGGYPEIFAGTFLCLIPYILIENYNIKANKSFKVVTCDTAKIFITLSICTVLGSLITLLPFIHSMSYITRGINASVQVAPVSVTALITSIVPGTSNVLPLEGDTSMIYSYMGIITIITLISMFYSRKKGYGRYLCIALFAFIMSQGTSFFLYTLFHKFVPLFGSFRFPSTWRCLFVIFLLIPCSMMWNEIEKEENSNRFIKITTIVGSILILLGCIVLITSYIIKDIVSNKTIVYLAGAIGVAGILTMMYIPIMNRIRNEHVVSKKSQVALICICIIEVLVFQTCEFPTTVGTYPQGNSDMQQINAFYQQYENRNRKFEFKDAKRTNTTAIYNNRDIMFNQDIDESGYMSFRLGGTQAYESSANRLIMTQNPMVYFTNNVITDQQVNLEQWLQNSNSPAAQIHVDKSLNIADNEKKYNIGELENVIKTDVKYEKQMDSSYRITNINAIDNRYTVKKLRIYTKGTITSLNNTNTFISNAEKVVLTTQGISSSNVIDVYFPLGVENVPYENISAINVKFNQQVEIEKVEYIEGQRITKDKDINIETYKLNSLKLNVNAATEGYVVVQQAIYPGWNVYINGQKAKMKTINGIFMGVQVPKGTSTIEFKFLPIDFIIGAIISVLYFIFMILLLIKDKYNDRISRTHSKKQLSAN